MKKLLKLFVVLSFLVVTLGSCEDLNKTYPDYLSNIDLEKAGIDEINKSHMRAQIAEKMKAAQLDKELQPILKELTDIQVEMADDIKKGIKKWSNYNTSLDEFATTYTTVFLKTIQDGEPTVTANNRALEATDEIIREIAKSYRGTGRSVTDYGNVMNDLRDITRGYGADAGYLVRDLEEIQRAFDAKFDWLINTSDIEELGLK